MTCKATLIADWPAAATHNDAPLSTALGAQNRLHAALRLRALNARHCCWQARLLHRNVVLSAVSLSSSGQVSRSSLCRFPWKFSRLYGRSVWAGSAEFCLAAPAATIGTLVIASSSRHAGTERCIQEWYSALHYTCICRRFSRRTDTADVRAPLTNRHMPFQ